MAYDELLAKRIESTLKSVKDISSKKMFGGMCYLYKGKMVCGVVKDDLVFRALSPDYESLLKEKGLREMDFTGKTMKEFVYASQDVLESESALQRFVEYGLEHAKSKTNK